MSDELKSETSEAPSGVARDAEIPIAHPLARFVDPAIFRATFAPDCMSHQCACRDVGDLPRLDACCQHGADVRLSEKATLLKRATEVASVLKPARRDPETWFDERETGIDSDFPGDLIIRTATQDIDDDESGCVFLDHTGPRGCGLHKAALEYGFSPAEIKPAVCRLYPLYLDEGHLALSSDFDRYSCANDGDQSVYRVMREELANLYGDDLVRTLDELAVRYERSRLYPLRTGV